MGGAGQNWDYANVASREPCEQWRADTSGADARRFLELTQA